MYEIITTVTNHHMLILSTARQHCVRNLTFSFCPLNVAGTVLQLWTGSSRNPSSINRYLYQLKYNSLFANFGGISPLIPNLGIRWRSVGSFTPRNFIPYGNTPCYALNGRKGGPQNHSGCFWNWEKSSVIVCDSNSSLLVQIIAYFYVILGTQN